MHVAGLAAASVHQGWLSGPHDSEVWCIYGNHSGVPMHHFSGYFHCPCTGHLPTGNETLASLIAIFAHLFAFTVLIKSLETATLRGVLIISLLFKELQNYVNKNVYLEYHPLHGCSSVFFLCFSLKQNMFDIPIICWNYLLLVVRGLFKKISVV